MRHPSVEGLKDPGPSPPIRANIISSGRQVSSPKPNCMAAACSAVTGLRQIEATRAAMSASFSRPLTQASDSSGSGGNCAVKDARKRFGGRLLGQAADNRYLQWLGWRLPKERAYP